MKENNYVQILRLLSRQNFINNNVMKRKKASFGVLMNYSIGLNCFYIGLAFGNIDDVNLKRLPSFA